MSALIIIAHVKDGVDLAVKHKLNPRIIDVIQEHHGDSLVYFFYRRAQEQKKLELEKVDRRLENPEDLPMIDEKNFRYPGPRPSTRESGIIALADTVESASRSLQKTHPGENPRAGRRPRPRARSTTASSTIARSPSANSPSSRKASPPPCAACCTAASTIRRTTNARPPPPSALADRDTTQGGRVIPMPKRA